MAEAGAFGEPRNGKAHANFSLKAAMAKEMKIDRTVDRRQPETRHHKVLDLLAHLFSVGFFVFHVFILRELTVGTYSRHRGEKEKHREHRGRTSWERRPACRRLA
jgi:hypothetical protein